MVLNFSQSELNWDIMNYFGTTQRAQLIRILKLEIIDILKVPWPIITASSISRVDTDATTGCGDADRLNQPGHHYPTTTYAFVDTIKWLCSFHSQVQSTKIILTLIPINCNFRIQTEQLPPYRI